MPKPHPLPRRRGLALLPVLLVCLTFLSPIPAVAACKLQQMTIPVRMVDRRPIADLTLNGTTVQLLVDSGAFFSMLSGATASQLNLRTRPLPSDVRIEGYTGRIHARLTRVEKVGLLNNELNNVEFLVGGNELGAGIMGILGRNLLSFADTEYDLAHGEVRLSLPSPECKGTSLAYWAGEAPVIETTLVSAHRAGDTAIQIEVKVNGSPTTAMLDTGAPSTSLTLKAARRAGIEDRDLTVAGRTGGAGAGRVRSWFGNVQLLEISGQKLRNNRLQIDDTDDSSVEMLLGLDYFLSHRIYVSRLQGKVYATWNGSPVFDPDPRSAGQYNTRYAALPQEVSRDDADALARRGEAAIASGDHVRALEDLNRACELAPGVAANFFARARLLLRMREPGRALADLDEALRLDPSLSEARMRRASLRATLSDRPGAQADLAALDRQLAESSHLRFDMGNLFADFGQVPDALRQYELWIKTHPVDESAAQVFNARCWLRARLQVDLPLALQDCREAIRRDAEASATHDSLGWTYLRLGDSAKAKAAFDRALQLEAAHAISLYGRAVALLRLNDAVGAGRDLAQARALNAGIDEELRSHGFEVTDGLLRSR